MWKTSAMAVLVMFMVIGCSHSPYERIERMERVLNLTDVCFKGICVEDRISVENARAVYYNNKPMTTVGASYIIEYICDGGANNEIIIDIVEAQSRQNFSIGDTS